MEENMTEVYASGPNDTITLAEVRKGSAYYQYDRYNAVSAGVKTVQKALHMYGFNLSMDGLFGSGTKAVVIGFQKENGLPMNGFIDKATLLKLEAWCGTLYETPQKEPLTKQIRFDLAELQQGNSGDAVTLVRSLLKKHGYTCDASGSYDAKLISVVEQFQRAKGLPVSGNVNQRTLAVLEDTTADTAWLAGNTVNLTAGKLARAGFWGILIKPEIVSSLNRSLNKYGITTGEKVLHFLAQMMAETSGSLNIMENGYVPGEIGSETYAPYYGAGVLQLTGRRFYSDFSQYIKNPDNGFTPDNEIFHTEENITANSKEEKELNTYVTQHVALKYPAISAGWVWEKAKELNLLKNVPWDKADTEARLISDKITKSITGETNASKLAAEQAKRFGYYQTIKGLLPYKK